MSSVTVRIPTPLRPFTGGADQVCVQARTVGEALTALGSAHSGVLERVMDPGGELRNFVNVYRGRDNVRSLNGLATPLAENDVISIVPAVAGGARKGKDRRLAELRANIPQVTPGEAARLQGRGAAVLDVRESDEVAQGSPVGAYRLGRG